MDPRVEIAPRAEQDLGDQFDYIARDSLDVAFRWLDSARTTFRQLAESPELGGRWGFEDPRLSEIRVWKVQGFKHHLVFYLPIEMGIRVIRILHGARDIDAVFESDE